MSAPRVWRIVAAIVGLLWLGSILVPAVEPQNDSAYPGYMILMLGWLGVFIFQFGWFANLLIPPALVLLLLERSSRLLPRLIGGGLLVFSLNALFWHEMYYDNGSSPIEVYHPGYFMWFLANLIAALALFARVHFQEEDQDEPVRSH